MEIRCRMEQSRSLVCLNACVCNGANIRQHGKSERRNWSTSVVRTVLLVSGALLLLAYNVSGPIEVYAQFPSLFPPPPNSAVGSAGGDDVRVPTNDRTPPEIELITTELREGKNVLVVRVTDESYLKSREVKYVNEGRIKFADLARDHDDVFHALINVEPPSGVIVVDVIDAAGNRATITEELPVTPTNLPNDFLDVLTDVWRNVLAFVGLR